MARLKCILGNEECSHCLRWKQCNFHAEYTIASQLKEKVVGTSKLVNYQRNAKIPYSFYKSRRGFPVLERKPVNVNIRFWRRTIFSLFRANTGVDTSLFQRRSIRKANQKGTRGEAMQEYGSFILRPTGALV